MALSCQLPVYLNYARQVESVPAAERHFSDGRPELAAVERFATATELVGKYRAPDAMQLTHAAETGVFGKGSGQNRAPAPALTCYVANCGIRGHSKNDALAANSKNVPCVVSLSRALYWRADI